MTSLKTHFDGKQIVVPAELMGASAQEITVVVDNEGVATPPRARSIFDLPRVEGPGRPSEDIVAEVREGRDDR